MLLAHFHPSLLGTQQKQEGARGCIQGALPPRDQSNGVLVCTTTGLHTNRIPLPGESTKLAKYRSTCLQGYLDQRKCGAATVCACGTSPHGESVEIEEGLGHSACRQLKQQGTKAGLPR